MYKCVAGVNLTTSHAGPCLIRSHTGSKYRAAAAGSYTGNLGIPEVAGIFQLRASSRTSYPGAIMTSLSPVQHAIRNPIYLIRICILDINVLIIINEHIYIIKDTLRTLISIQI